LNDFSRFQEPGIERAELYVYDSELRTQNSELF
jgi:hypothetical protein